MRRVFIAAICGATLSSPASAEIEPCLVGTWVADLADIADMMALQMQGAAWPVGGEVSMAIAPDGSFQLLANDMIISVAVPNVAPMSVKVVGYSAGSFNAVENVFDAVVVDYNLVGSADVLGHSLAIPFTSATGLGGGGIGWFECTGDTLRFEATVGGAAATNRMPRIWNRVH